jgi:glycerophosphoryl diester phosphodiesterase
VAASLPSLESPPVGFAHRGARAHAPENTIEAFTLALRLGATGLESDAWLTRDGVVVLDHDGVLRQGMRRRPISNFDRASVPERIPSLSALFDECGSSFHLSLDLKDPDTGPAVIELVRDRRSELLPRLWLCHPDVDLLKSLRNLDDQVRLVHSTRLRTMHQGPERQAADLAEGGIDAVNLHHTDWTGGLTTLFHRFEVRCMAWDVQQRHQLSAVLRMGMDAVFSDFVDRMTEALTEIAL